MPYDRTGYAPWSLTREAGVQSATVDGTLKVPQYGQPTIDIGFIDEKGNWQGRKSSDEQFIGITKALAVANNGTALFPETNNFPSINCDGFNALQFAIKVTNAGSYLMEAVMGPDTTPFANLTPVNSGEKLRITDPNSESFENILDDSGESLTADVWEVYTIAQSRIQGQRNLQIKISNGSGGASDIEFGFRRLV
jgi:hypothetical protein